MLGVSGRIAATFLKAQITPLLALVAFLLGVFAVLVTPREEEPQINVTMANLIIGFPGASVQDVEQMVTTPAEQVMARMEGVEHVMSVSHPGLAIVTVQFKVGVSNNDALVRLHDTVRSHSDWLPIGLGVLEPVIKPKGIDDVPIVSITLLAKDEAVGAFDLERVAHSVEAELKRVAGTRDVRSIGGPGRAVMIEIDPAKMAGLGVSIQDIRQALTSANQGLPVGDLLDANRRIQIEAGPWLSQAQDLEDLVLAVKDSRAVFLHDVATIRDGPMPAQRYVWHGEGLSGQGKQYPAISLSVTKKPGENAIDVAQKVLDRMQSLEGSLIPQGISYLTTRNYGETANDKAQKLIQKLLFATASVVALVFIALGRREAAIVGVAVILTLTVTLFASWAWGFTLNRVSLFALIFSIGILVDDAIVVVENIHRHQALYPDKSLSEIIPGAVDEVGGPTILATLTVIAALLPMAFVSGLMGPYMSPIPINASMGMLLSLAIAFIITPWLARLWMKSAHTEKPNHHTPGPVDRVFRVLFTPLLHPIRGGRHRLILSAGMMGLIGLSVALPALGLVVLKMLPFDNKSEFQVIVDMPAGTPLEKTAAALRDLGAYLSEQPEVAHYQAYAGTASPINFNGLVRQYDLRSMPEMGDLQVNLVDKHQRKEQSHAIASRFRADLQAIGKRFDAKVKVVEVPPGPPVLSPIVAEIYGPDAQGRKFVAETLRARFQATADLVDIDDSGNAVAPRRLILVDRRKAALHGVSQQAIVSSLRAGLQGETLSYLHDASKYPVPFIVQLPPEKHGDLDALLQLGVRSSQGKLIAIRELVGISDSVREQRIYHKDLLPVHYVTADLAGGRDSPLYGMFEIHAKLDQIKAPDGSSLQSYFVRQPGEAWRGYALKWDGEWQITYETFRDMGLAYGLGLILIYLLVVAQFGSYLTPLIIMAPIPLTVIGVMPGHALLGSQFTATSMIGMIALAGIIVRNSILLVDFIRLQLDQGKAFEAAIVDAAITRAQPIVLTGLAAMLGAFFILDDPIFNGLAISLIFGIFVSTVLTLVVIPTMYYAAYRRKYTRQAA